MSGAFKAGLVGVGAAGGLLLGVAAKGGAELNQAMADFQVQTGASAQEAEAASHSIAKLYANNLNGMGELGNVLAAVHSNLGLTGQAAEDAAQHVIDYAKVTGQDAVDAVGTLDDLTDGYNLTADQQVKVLDLLKAGTEKYGGSIVDNQKALADLAPALTAANLSYEDGASLLNLFASAGIDAAAAPGAMTKALAKVKSPEELKKLLEDISKIEDPFKRAEAASELFGKKAGPQLAQALGKGDLDTFRIGMDEAAGSVEDASKAIDNMPQNKLKLFLRSIAGPAAEAGKSFGPLIGAFAQLGGGKLITGVGAGLGSLAGSVLPKLAASVGGLLPALLPALGGLGSAMGGVIAAAIPIGMAALPFLLVAALVAAVAFLIANPEIVGKLVEFAGEVVHNIVAFLAGLPQAIADLFGRAFGSGAQAALEKVGEIVAAVLGIPAKLLQLPTLIAGKFIEAGTAALLAVQRFVGGVVDFILGIPGKIADLVGRIGRVASDAAAALLAPFARAVDKIRADIASIVSIGGPSQDVQGFIDRFKATHNGRGPSPVEFQQFKNGTLPGFDQGTDFVPADMLAFLHRGERVLTAAENRAIASGRASLGDVPELADGAGTTVYQITVPVSGLAPARTPDDIARPLRQLAQSGYLARPQTMVALRPSKP